MKIAITGAGGYVGSSLVPHLLKKGHKITAIDTFWFGDTLNAHHSLKKVKEDIRNQRAMENAFKDQEAVIHLACVSNDPSFDMNPKLGRDVNYLAFRPLIQAVKNMEVNRFIYASSSSVYGVKNEENVTEEMKCEPLTDYSKYKLACELELKSFGMGGAWTIIRPATVSGYSPRMRFDLVVNILTLDAIKKKKITVHGGFQMRPNIHVKDMIMAYEMVLDAPEQKINQQTYNVGGENYSLEQIAHTIKDVLKDDEIQIVREESKDPRSYHINSKRILNDLGFECQRSIPAAVNSIKDALTFDMLKDPANNSNYYNIIKMRELGLT